MGSNQSAVAVHLKIIGDFETRILSGYWHTGFRIPTEHEIALEYDCSRPTVAKALMLLEQKGMIERRKRAGSFVRRPPSQSIILQILDPATEINARGQVHRYELLSRTIRKPTVAERQKLRMRGNVAHVTSRHWAGGTVYCHEDRRFNLATIPDAEEADFASVPPSDWLIRRMPWRTGENFIFAEEAVESLASVLEVKVGAALMCVERHVYLKSEYLSFSTTHYPASQQRLRSHYDTGPQVAVGE